MIEPYDDIKLVAIDLDGTLFDSTLNLSPVNIDAIHRAQAAELKIILASGRPPFGILPVARKLNLDGFVIAYNGSTLLDIKTGMIFYNRPLFARDTHTVIRMIRKYELYVSLHCGMEFYAEKTCKETVWEASHFDQPQRMVKDLILDAPAEPNKLEVTTLDRSPHLESLWQDLVTEMPHLRIHHQANFYLEIMHQGATKETALALACGLSGIYPRQVLAIGNAMNDVGMLGFAGISVAVGNAPEYLKQITDWQVASNNEDGVAEAIHHILDARTYSKPDTFREKQLARNERTGGQLQ